MRSIRTFAAAFAAALSVWFVGSGLAHGDSGTYLTPWEFFAQHPLETIGHSEFPRFDVNQDGVPDMIVGLPAYDEDGQAYGRVVARSGWAFGPRTLLDVSSTESNDLFGTTAIGIEGFFGEGSAAVVVGAPKSSAAGHEAGGRVYIYGGAGWDSIIQISGTHAHAGLGVALASIGDVNGDGATDLALGVPGDDPTTPGKVYVFFGREAPATGVTLTLTTADVDLVLSSGQTSDWFGFSISGGYDLTGDAIPDIAVGAPARTHNGHTAAGAVYLFDGATGALHTSVIGQSENARAGFSVLVTAPDQTSQQSHLLIGAPGDIFAPFDALRTKGKVAVFAGPTLAGGDGAFVLSEADRTLMAVEPTASLFGTKLDREYAQPGQDSQGVLIGYGLLVPATPQIIDAFSLDFAIWWHVSLAMTSKYESPFTTEAYRFLTESGSGQQLSHPYVPPAVIPDDESLTMKHHGDATLDYQINFADVQAILEKLGAAGQDAGAADVDGDGVVTLGDMALALDNQGMTLLQAIRADCERLFLEGLLPDPCECQDELLGRPPANFMIDRSGNARGRSVRRRRRKPSTPSSPAASAPASRLRRHADRAALGL